MDRIYTVVKKSKTLANNKEYIAGLIKKIKNPDSVAKTDLIDPAVPEELVKNFEEIKEKDEEQADAELWKPDSLCFRYYNILQHYKATKQVWIWWF